MISALSSDICLSFMRRGEDGKFEPELSSLSSRINVLYLLIWSCFKVKVHSRKQMKKRSPRKSPSLILPFTKKLAIELNNHQKLKCPGSCPRRMFKLRVDRRIICIASGESRCRSIGSLFCRVSEFYTHYFHNGVFCSIVPFRFVKPSSPQVNLYERQVEEQSSPYPHQR